MHQKLYFIIALIFCGFIFGCKEVSGPLSKCVVYDNQQQKIRTIEQSESLALLHDAWKTKQQVVFKKAPDFKYILEVTLNGQVQKWNYSTTGIISQINGKDGNYYKLSSADIINKLIMP